MIVNDINMTSTWVSTQSRNFRFSAKVESRSSAGVDAETSSRFPTPLIKPDVPISSIRLSDWFHRRLVLTLVRDILKRFETI
jgi:hypothetical protein